MEHAWEFAARNQLLRDNEVHGEEEAKLVIENAFSFDRSENERMVQTMNMSIEEPHQHSALRIPCEEQEVAEDVGKDVVDVVKLPVVKNQKKMTRWKRRKKNKRKQRRRGPNTMSLTMKTQKRLRLQNPKDPKKLEPTRKRKDSCQGRPKKKRRRE